MISPASQPPGFHCYDGHAGFVSGIATVPSEGRPATHLITLAADDGAMLYLGLWKDLFMGLRCFSTEANWCTKSFDWPWDHNWTYQLGQTAKVSRWLSPPRGKVSGLPWHILRQWRFVSCATKTAPQTCAWEDKEWQRRSKNLMPCLAWWI